jgi:hypothetical protein
VKQGRKYEYSESHPATPRRKPFVVSAPATMLKRHAILSRNARFLYTTLLGLADGQTGELKISGRWLKATAFDRAAEMCRDVRMRCMKELIAFGFVTFRRERVKRFIKGRQRVVLGAYQYTVHKNPCVLLKSISSTVEEIDSQVFPNPPVRAGGSLFPDSENALARERAKSSSAPPHRTIDDDDLFSSQSNLNPNVNGKINPNGSVENEQSRIDKLISRAAAILERRGDYPLFVAEALAFIDQRSHDAGTVPGSERYFLVAYETLLETREDLAEVTDLVIRKKHLREQFMPDPIVPNEKDAEKITLLHRAVEQKYPVNP